MNLDNDIAVIRAREAGERRPLRLGPLHQLHPGRSRSLIRHHNRLHRSPPCPWTGYPCTVLTQRQRMGHHLIAWSEIRYLVTHGLDYSSGLDAEGHRGRRANIPLTGPNEIVPIPHTGCLHRDQNLIARRTTRLAEVKHMYRTAYSGDASSLHVDLLSVHRVTSH